MMPSMSVLMLIASPVMPRQVFHGGEMHIRGLRKQMSIFKSALIIIGLLHRYTSGVRSV